MSAAKLYPDMGEEKFYGPSDYSPILHHLGVVVVREDDCDWQGDSRVLYLRPDGNFGYLCFGWGSCSGCDALRACETYAEIDNLIEFLRKSIKWDTPEALLAFFENHDWEGDYSFSPKFNARVMEVLRAKVSS